MAKRSKWSLVGVPDHQGVIHVGGRIGAARGPLAFRRILGKLKGRDGVLEACVDAGDAVISSTIEDSHENAAELVARAHSSTRLSVVVGGGHDHGYSHLLGLKKAKAGRLACINLDAHLDVRKPEPLITSGSPFYLAVENGIVSPSRLLEFGIQAHCNGTELWEYISRKRIPVVPFERLRHGRAPAAFKRALSALSRSADEIAISLDLDCAAAAHAPGVSAPQSEGFDPSDVIEMMELAGANKKVTSLGIFELNPEHDIDGRTARLAATAAYHFIAAALRASALRRK